MRFLWDDIQRQAITVEAGAGELAGGVKISLKIKKVMYSFLLLLS